MTPPAQFFILKIAFVIWGLLCLHTDFKSFCPSSVKHATGLIDRNCSKSVDYLGHIVILTVLILLIQESQICTCDPFSL